MSVSPFSQQGPVRLVRLFYAFMDRRCAAIQLLFRRILFPGFLQYSSYHSLQFPSSFISLRFVSVDVMHPHNRTDTKLLDRPLHKNVTVLDVQQEITYNSSVQKRDAV